MGKGTFTGLGVLYAVMVGQVALPGRAPELKKHVAAIHSSSKLTLVQRKIANALLYSAYKHLLDRDRHQIHIADLCELIGYHSKDFQTIKDSLVALISAVVEWNVVENSKGENTGIWNASAIIADASIEGPLCTYSYSQKMRELFYRPEVYGQLNMAVLAKFKSTYGLALYENCIRYKNVHKTPWLTIKVFRSLMGVDEKKYLVYKDFKKRVLDKAVEEVNKHSSITVLVNTKKQGRKTVALQFNIRRKSELKVERLGSTDLQTRVQQDFGFSSSQLRDVFSSYDKAFILEKINIIEGSKAFKEGKISNLAKYLLSALENDFQAPKNSQDQIRGQRAKVEHNEEAMRQRQAKIGEYRKYQDKSFLALFDELSEKEKKPVITVFEEHIKSSIYADLFAKEGLSNVLVVDNFCNFIRSSKPEWAQNMLSFDDYCLNDKKAEGC